MHASYRTLFEEDWTQLRASIKFAVSYEEKWPNLVPLFEQISAQNGVFIMIWNMITNRIIYVTDKKSVTGHPASSYLADNGTDFSVSNMHPECTSSLVIMQHECVNYFLTNPEGGPMQTVANVEGLCQKSDGKYFHFLQQSVCIETDSIGQPFLFLSYVHDVSHIKKNGTANLVITSPDVIKWWDYNFDLNCLELIQPFSKQEKKILTSLAEGKNTKEIAGELFISPLTVDTHRKNLLRKTNCVDTTGMITYIKLVGLI